MKTENTLPRNIEVDEFFVEFTVQDALELQAIALAQWKTVLAPEVFAILEKVVGLENEILFDVENPFPCEPCEGKRVILGKVIDSMVDAIADRLTNGKTLDDIRNELFGGDYQGSNIQNDPRCAPAQWWCH